MTHKISFSVTSIYSRVILNRRIFGTFWVHATAPRSFAFAKSITSYDDGDDDDDDDDDGVFVCNQL